MAAKNQTQVVEQPVSRIQAMRAALKTIQPPKEEVGNDGFVAEAIGAVVPTVKTFFDNVKTSYQYHEAVRKELLS